VDPVERARSASRRLTEPVDSVAQAVARRATELVVDALDVNALLGQVDVNKLIDQVDLDKLLDRVDVNRVLDRVDMARVISRVDMDAVLSRVDVNAIADRVDVGALLDKTELSALLTRSSSTVFSEGVDLLRSQAVGLDNFIARWAGRALGRGTRRPAAPAAPAGLRGHYAGFVSRFAGYAIDLGVISGLFGLALAAISFAASLITTHTVSWDKSGLLVAIAYGCWSFAYFGYAWAASGKTFGMAVLGIQVVSRDGQLAAPRHGIVRALAFPLSFLLLGLGFVGILTGRERRALHDVIAGTAVVYTWDARAQQLRFLARGDHAQLPAQPDAQVPAQPGPPAHEAAASRG
jgi:uncharacterized RDD family membrane protein YckC